MPAQVTLGGSSTWFAGAAGESPGSENGMVALAVTRADTAQNRPELVNAFRAAMQEGLDALANNREPIGGLPENEHFETIDPVVWTLIRDRTKTGFPGKLAFARASQDFWLAGDPKGVESYEDVHCGKIAHAAVQA